MFAAWQRNRLLGLLTAWRRSSNRPIPPLTRCPSNRGNPTSSLLILPEKITYSCRFGGAQAGPAGGGRNG